jgi:hypothetical protein
VTRLDEYLKYQKASFEIGDVDPGYSMLLYVCDRFELNREQRYWIAWLYAMTYCGASAFYLYNEFPDFERVDVGRMRRWWEARGRDEMIVQTDRRWVRSSNMFVPAFESYRDLISGRDQHEYFDSLCWADTPEKRYENVYGATSNLYSFGQFAMFLYLEALHTITPTDLMPTDLDLDKAWSCRNGLYYAYGRDDLVEDEETRIRPDAVADTDRYWTDLKLRTTQFTSERPTIWQTETLLCAYRKWHRGKRYVGYYLDRQAQEIAKMSEKVPRGVRWEVLWDYRSENLKRDALAELHDGLKPTGALRSWWKEQQLEKTREALR